MARHYLTPEQLRTIPVANLSDGEVQAAIDKRCHDVHVADEVDQAAKVLREAGIPVNEESLVRLRRRVR